MKRSGAVDPVLIRAGHVAMKTAAAMAWVVGSLSGQAAVAGPR